MPTNPPRPTAADANAWLNEVLVAPSLGDFRNYMKRLTDCGEQAPLIAALLVLADNVGRAGVEIHG
jgi:hypothetical protein